MQILNSFHKFISGFTTYRRLDVIPGIPGIGNLSTRWESYGASRSTLTTPRHCTGPGKRSVAGP